ncbi:hypothetical protein FD755_015650 [Muntiacus reevesi]|uniref:Uncharacterized protein n=1 Tax=Muntiacus reevesi TaxID=9886 RepID=A0A5N3XIJ0_MUNRE|nr:hypothetical protein FD755_015650 [Muntiacus reevesi]
MQETQDTGSIPGFGKIPWSRKWQTTLVYLPGKFHGQKNLAFFAFCHKGGTICISEKENVHPPPIAPPPVEIPDHFIMPPDKHHMSHILSKQHNVPHEHCNQPHTDIHAPPAELFHLYLVQSGNLSSLNKDLIFNKIFNSNLITPLIQDDSNSGAKELSPPTLASAHHHPEYQGQPMVSHPYHIMAPQQQYVLPRPPPPPINHSVPQPPQATGTPHLIPPPSQHGGRPITVHPPHHYNHHSSPQFTEDQRTLSLPFIQPQGMSPGIYRPYYQ